MKAYTLNSIVNLYGVNGLKFYSVTTDLTVTHLKLIVTALINRSCILHQAFHLKGSQNAKGLFQYPNCNILTRN